MRPKNGPTKVYAVVSGAYSDYGVHCVFATERDALAYAHRLAGPDAMFREGAAGSGFWNQILKYDMGGYGVEPFDFYGPGEIPAL